MFSFENIPLRTFLWTWVLTCSWPVKKYQGVKEFHMLARVQ